MKKFPAIIELTISSEKLSNIQQMTINFIRSDKCYEEKQCERSR